MGKLTLDAETIAKLDELTGKTEIYDERGKLVAVAIQPAVYEVLNNPRSAFGPFTEAELAAADLDTGPGRLLEDILADLRAGR